MNLCSLCEALDENVVNKLDGLNAVGSYIHEIRTDVENKFNYCCSFERILILIE